MAEKRIPWNKGKKGIYTPEQRERISIGTKTAMQAPEIRQKISVGLKGKYTGKNSHRWVGDNITKKPLHRWVDKELGRPQECENCGDVSKRTYDWANISGEYKRDIADWVRLCRPCHNRFDNYVNKSWITRRKK